MKGDNKSHDLRKSSREAMKSSTKEPRNDRKRPHSDNHLPASKHAKSTLHKPSSRLGRDDTTYKLSQAAPEPAADRSKLIAGLPAAYTVSSLGVSASSHINKKVSKVLELLADFSFATTEPKPNIVILSAKASAASKMISVVEISKREIDKAGGKWYQYNCVEPVVEIAGESGENRNNAVPAERDGEDQAFETLKTPFERAVEGRPKIQAVPSMTVFLSRVRIESLKKSYGEQTNA